MAATRDSTAANIKPLEGAIIRRYTLGATTAAGEVVSMQSDGKVDPADATSAKSIALGVAIQGGADGDRVDIVIFGPVLMMTGATVGAPIYTATSAGELSESAGTYGTIVGLAESATVLIVRPHST